MGREKFEFQPPQEPSREPSREPREWEHYGEREIEFKEGDETKFTHRRTGKEEPPAKTEEEPKDPFRQLTESEKERVNEKMEKFQPDSPELLGYSPAEINEIIEAKRRKFSKEELARREKTQDTQE